MYRYRDVNGNNFVLLEDDTPRLRFEPAFVSKQISAQATATNDQYFLLDSQAYMTLITAFEAAIDNKVFHRELCNHCTGMIVTEENGQLRRYILSPNCEERRALESALQLCIAG